MTTAYGPDYARFYDLLYEDKAYRREAGFVLQLARRCGLTAPRSAMDFACGTGRHLQELARQGLAVAGADVSAAMLAVARRRFRAAGLQAQWRRASMARVRLDRPVDLGLCLFASLNYLLDGVELDRSLENMARYLRPHGVLVLEVWNGTAVCGGALQRLRKVVRRRDGLRVERRSRNRLLPLENQVEVRFELVWTEGGVRREARETHRIRYHFLPDLEDRLARAGLRIAHACPTLHPERVVRPATWAVSVACVKRR